MKKMIILLAFVTSIQICFAQDTSTLKTQPLTVQEEYLRTSKRQKKAAIILASAGAALFITGFAIASSDNYDDDGVLPGTLLLTGAAAMLGSIPLFISAGKNRKRGLSVSFKNESAQIIQGNIVYFRSLPSLNFRFGL